MSRRDLSVKGGTSERCYHTRRGRTDEQRYAIISPYFDGRIKMNGPYPEITNISFLAKLFYKTFISLKHLSDYRTVGRTIGLSVYSYGPSHALLELYLLQGLYVPCPVRTLFITGAICPMPMWNFIYYRGYMSHALLELYLLQGLYVPCPVRTLFITGAICPMPC